MSDQVPIKPSDLKSLLKFEGSYNYSLQRFIDIGRFRSALLLQDKALQKDALAKIVDEFNEGEFIHWSHLRHENVNLLLDMVPLACQKTIFVFSFYEKTLKTVVTDGSFQLHPKCFDRKRSYVTDVLSGLEYLHQKSLSLMNLDGENVLICSKTDKAVISDLSSIVSAKTTPKTNCPITFAGFFFLENDADGEFDCMQFDTWSCGVMFLQMFTVYTLPRCRIDYFKGLTPELLRRANPGANLPNDTAINLKDFLAPFFENDPNVRMNTESALVSVFLQSSAKRIDEEARDFWEASETGKLMSGGMFGKVGKNLGTGDIYWKRKDPCRVNAKMAYFTDLKLKKSVSNNELYAIVRESNTEANSFHEATTKNHSIENSPLDCLSQQTWNSEDNLRDFFAWVYDDTCAVETRNLSKIEKEVRSNLELNDESPVNILKTSKNLARNLNSQDSSKCCTKEKYSEISSSIFDLPCRCVFCTGTFDEESPLKLIHFWSFPYIPTQSNEQSYKKSSSMHFGQTEGGLFHNISKPERSNASAMNNHDSVKEKSPKQSNEKDLMISWINTNEVLELLNTTPENLAWPKTIENSEMATPEMYEPSLIPGENQLMFQKCTGFRGGSKIIKPTSYPQPVINTKPPMAFHPRKDHTSGEMNKVLSDGRMTHALDNKHCVKKGNKSTKKKDSGKTHGVAKPKVPMANQPRDERASREMNKVLSDGSMTRALGNEHNVKKGNESTKKKEFDKNPDVAKSKVTKETKSINNKVVDISMELPLCVESSEEKGKSFQVALTKKPKQNWIRVLCPGSVHEDKL